MWGPPGGVHFTPIHFERCSLRPMCGCAACRRPSTCGALREVFTSPPYTLRGVHFAQCAAAPLVAGVLQQGLITPDIECASNSMKRPKHICPTLTCLDWPRWNDQFDYQKIETALVPMGDASKEICTPAMQINTCSHELSTLNCLWKENNNKDDRGDVQPGVSLQFNFSMMV